MKMNIQNSYSIYIPKDEKSWMIYTRVANAAKTLTGTGFKLYLYLYFQEQETEGNFSPAALLRDFGVSISSAHRAIKELIEKGYLFFDNNHYIFLRDSSK